MLPCSSGFVQCVAGRLIARWFVLPQTCSISLLVIVYISANEVTIFFRCPGESLFDDRIGLCIYDLEGCAFEEEEEVEAPQADVNGGFPSRSPQVP